jgi:hypothetical protein
MHASPNVILGCVDCHGGNSKPGLTIKEAHVQPAPSGVVAFFGQSAELECRAESRISGVHSVHQSR